ncbi:unnamed protein product [Arabidopsis halleri]
MDYPKRSRSSDDDSHDFKRQRIADPGRPSKSFTLENGLKVFVFSGGEDVEVSSAAMTVRVGSFADPLEIPGLAHVIEHILFRGSQKFSSVNEVNYVAKYDGGTNAHTEFDHTTFSFEVDPEHFHGALDRFSHLFINPLMETERLEHEIDAMDSGTNTLQTVFSQLIQMRRICPSYILYFFKKFFYKAIDLTMIRKTLTQSMISITPEHFYPSPMVDLFRQVLPEYLISTVMLIDLINLLPVYTRNQPTMGLG